MDRRSYCAAYCRAKRLWLGLILSFICAVLLCGVSLLPFGLNNEKSASALTSAAIKSAVQVGGGADLWDPDDETVNGDVVDDLYDNLFGSAKEVDYIKENGAEDYEKYKQAENPYWVVPATAINAKLNDGAGNDYGLVVTLGGMPWTVASLTLADVNGKQNQVIATLYLADAYKVNSLFYTKNNVNGASMYSSSVLRNNILSWADFKLFSDGTDGSFASQFLVQPKNIEYQQLQTQVGRENRYSNFNMPNEALGALSSGWENNTIKRYSSPEYSQNGVEYKAWGEDYIWFPSATEVGFTSFLQTSSIWNLSTKQRERSISCWLRSGNYYLEISSCIILADGRYNDMSATSVLGVCPAIHFNLSECAAACRHKWSDWSVTSPATHISDGARTRTCSECGKVKTETIPASTDAHSWDGGTVTTAATCTAAGEMTYTCTQDNTHTKTETIAAKGHTVVTDPAVLPTCTADGKTDGSRCSDCNMVITAQQTIPALGHSWDGGAVTTPATCAAAGVKTYTCARDGTHTKTEPIPIDHSAHNAVTDPAVLPTCLADGKTVGSHCSLCNTVISAQTAIPATGHSWDNGVETKSPTCTVDGEKLYTCARDGTHTKTEPVTATGHTLITDPAVAPACTATGLTEGKHCSVCNEIITPQQTVPATGHTEVTDPAVAETCTVSGLTAGKHCSVCNGIIIAQTVIPAKGHDWDGGAVTTAATCTAQGVKTYTCNNDPTHTKIEAVEKISHNYAAGAVTPPTEEESGYTTYTCISCGNSYKGDYVLPIGHNYTAGQTVQPTCEAQGYTRYICLDCGNSYNSDYVSALGHDYTLECKWTKDCEEVTEAKLVCSRGCEREVAEKEMSITEDLDGDGNRIKTVTVIAEGGIYKDTVTVSDTPDNPDDPNNPDNPDNPNNPDDPNNPDNPTGDKPAADEEGGTLWILFLILGILFIIGTIIAIIIVKRNGKDDEEPAEYDYEDGEDEDW